MEIWKDISNYEGIYQASNLGRIRTAEGKVTYSCLHGERHWKQRILKPKKDKQNCLRVSLWKNGKNKDYLVARLVCATWNGNLIDTDMTVNHIDGNRLNNVADNLEWLSREDNIKHGFENKLYDSICNKVMLIDLETFDTAIYRSQSYASKMIGKNESYINSCLKRNCVAKGADGRMYQVLLIKD